LTGIADVRGPDAAQQRHLLGRAHDVDQRDAVRRADLLQHVSEIRRRGGVHQPGVALHPHGLDHAQRREGIHETRGGVHRGGPVREDQAVRGGDAAVLRIHGATPYANDFAEEGVRRVRRPCRHHDATPFIPRRNGQANATRRGLHRLWRECRPHRGRGHTRISYDRAHICTGEHDTQIGRIDGRRCYPHHDVVGPGRRQVGFDQGKGDGAILMHG
jgi:hypothetical protein